MAKAKLPDPMKPARSGHTKKMCYIFGIPAGLGPGRDGDRLGPVEGLDVDLGAERGLRHRHVLGGDEIGSGTLESGVRRNPDVDVEIPRDAAAHRRAAGTGDAQRRAVVDAAGHVDGDRPFVEATAVAPAVRASATR